MRRHLLLCALAMLPVAASAELSAQRQGELLHMLRHDCGSCHGMTLKGGLGPALLPESLTGKAPETLSATILYGRGATAMPPWKEILTEEEADWIISVLREGLPHD